MQVESSKSEVEHGVRRARAALAQSAPNTQGQARLLLPGIQNRNQPESSEYEVEESGDDLTVQDPNIDDTEVDDILRDEHLDDDVGDDITLTLYVDLLSLQNRVSRLAASVLRTTASIQGPSLDSSSNTETNSTHMESVRAEPQVTEGNEPIEFEDHLSRRTRFPFGLCKSWAVSQSGDLQ